VHLTDESDSGGQYYDGTIDTTRTIFFGKNPPEDVKRAYTRVLQCHITAATATFPQGMDGDRLIMLGKAALYECVGRIEGGYMNSNTGTGLTMGMVWDTESGTTWRSTNVSERRARKAKVCLDQTPSTLTVYRLSLDTSPALNLASTRRASGVSAPRACMCVRKSR
jgi:hypothetical protein